MAEKKKFPSVPSNYVSILQLQERWIKQKQLEKEKQEQQEQQRRREDEEEEEQKRLKQEQQRRREDDEEEERKRLKQEQDDQKNKRDGKRRCEEPNVADSVAPPPSLKTRTPYNRRKAKEAGKVKDEADVEAKPEQVVVLVAGEVVRDGEGKTDDAKEKWRKKRDSKKGKYKNEEVVIVDMEPAMEVVAVVEDNILARRNSEGIGKRSEWRRKSVNAVANGKVVEAKDDPTVEIGQKLEEVKLEQKFGELSVNRRKGEGRKKARLRFERSGGGGGRRKEEAVVGDMEPVVEVVLVEENVPARRNRERKGKRSEWRWKSENAVANGKVVEAKDDPTVDIGEKLEELELDQKFGELSVNRRKREGKEKAKLRFERNGGGGGRRMDSGRFGGGLERGDRRPRDGSLVWVKKEEVPDGNVA